MSVLDETHAEQGGGARDVLFMAIAGPSGFVRLEWSEDGRWRPMWVSCGDLEKLRHHGLWFAERCDVVVGVAPHAGRSRDDVLPCGVLWAVTDSRSAVRRLRGFRPAPTLVLREGATVRETAVWALDRPLTWDWTVRANRRLAHAIRGPKRWCDPTHAIRLPGSCLREGKMFPLPVVVVVESRTDRLYSAREVVGHLPEAPDPNAWREAT